MAVKKRPATPAEKPRTNTPLLFLILLIIPFYGGYYTFSVLLCGAVLVPVLVHASRRAGTLLLPTGVQAWCLYGICAFQLLALPAAVSVGMAFAGWLRTMVWILFFLCAATYSPPEREAILDAVAYEGGLLSLLSTVTFLYNNAAGLQDANGRIDGPFQYANAWALYLLVCLLLLALRRERRRADWPAMAAITVGIFLSGSRGIFLLALLLAVLGGGWYILRRRRVLPVLLAAMAVAALGALAVLASGGVVLERLGAITLSSSSLNGRLLYALDALQMLLRHPFGLGRGGYLYLQALEQTGVYTLRAVHNEYLQAALDGGIPAGILTAALAAALLLRKNVPLRERAVMFAISVHALIDFDFHFTAVVFLLLLCGAGGRCRRLTLPSRPALAAAGAAVLVFGYFAAVYYMDFSGRTGAAWAMFPADLSLAENRLQSCASIDEAEPIADRILEQTDLSMLAWDCKFAAAARRASLPDMVEAKFRYLRLNRYRGEVYKEFTALLENAWAQGSPEELSIYRYLAQTVIEQLEEVRAHTNPLAYRLADKPDLDFSQEILQRLQILKER